MFFGLLRLEISVGEKAVTHTDNTQLILPSVNPRKNNVGI